MLCNGVNKGVFTGTLTTIVALVLLCLAGYVLAHTQWVSGIVTIKSMEGKI
jgi:hypothetical protein